MKPPPNPAYCTVIAPAAGRLERLCTVLLRGFLYLVLRPGMGPPWPVRWQRAIIWLLSLLMPRAGGVRFRQRTVSAVPVEIVEPDNVRNAAVLLYLHGGAFMLGSPRTHRALTTRLARETGSAVWVPHYRLAPENPHPAGLNDCLACYRALLAEGVPAQKIVIAGDSAGGGLTLALSLSLKRLDLPQPAGLMLISPVTDSDLHTASHIRFRHSDPVLRPGLLRQAMRAYRLPDSDTSHRPLRQHLSGMPPLLIHVGSIESLRDDSTRLAAHAYACGVDVRLEIYTGLWHVLHLFAGIMHTARDAVSRLAQRFGELTQEPAAAAPAKETFGGTAPRAASPP